jgi:hypothetical protein
MVRLNVLWLRRHEHKLDTLPKVRKSGRNAHERETLLEIYSASGQ